MNRLGFGHGHGHHPTPQSQSQHERSSERLPADQALDAWARVQLARQPDRTQALADLATGGDDDELIAAAPQILPGFTVVGRLTEGAGCQVRLDGQPVSLVRTGWRHGNDG